MKYRKKMADIEAARFTLDGVVRGPARMVWKNDGEAGGWCVTTPSGPAPVRPGDWIGLQVLPDGTFDYWPIDPDVFEATYELAPEGGK